MIRDHNAELEQLGEGRPMLSDKRAYLVSIAERFQVLLREGLSGLYRLPFFRDEDCQPKWRLRAEVAKRSADFANAMMNMGHAFVDQESDIALSPMDTGTHYTSSLPAPKLVPFAEMHRIARQTLEANGQDLPDMFDSNAVGDLFAQQASPWRAVAEVHVRDLWSLCKDFLDAAVDNFADPACANALKLECIEPAMNTLMQARLASKIEELVKPYKSSRPVTNNPQYMKRATSLEPTRWGSPQESQQPPTTEITLLRTVWAYYEVCCCKFGIEHPSDTA